LPERLPADAVAADRTKIVVLPTVPPACVSVTLLPKPLPAVSDTSKPLGAVAVIFAVKLTPETVNCWTSGLADAVPAQADIVPDAVPAVITGGGGFTVIVNVTGIPLQTAPPVKLPNE